MTTNEPFPHGFCENPGCYAATRQHEDFCSAACWDAYHSLGEIEWEGAMQQIQKIKQAKPSKPVPLDTRTPSGKTLPY